MRKIVLTLLVAVAAGSLVADVPITPAHEQYLERGIMAIVHWGPNTYTGQEWGFGNAKPEIMQPAVRYAATVKDTGEVEYGETNTAKWMTGKEKENEMRRR